MGCYHLSGTTTSLILRNPPVIFANIIQSLSISTSWCIKFKIEAVNSGTVIWQVLKWLYEPFSWVQTRGIQGSPSSWDPTTFLPMLHIRPLSLHHYQLSLSGKQSSLTPGSGGQLLFWLLPQSRRPSTSSVSTQMLLSSRLRHSEWCAPYRM